MFSVPLVFGLSVHPTPCLSVVLEVMDEAWAAALTLTWVIVTSSSVRRCGSYMIIELGAVAPIFAMVLYRRIIQQCICATSNQKEG